MKEIKYKFQTEKYNSPFDKPMHTIPYKGIEIDVIERPDVLWVGFLDYMDINDDLKRKALMKRYDEEFINAAKHEIVNPDWRSTLFLNRDTVNKPYGEMRGYETYSDNQDKQLNLFIQPGGLWLRIQNHHINAIAIFGTDRAGNIEQEYLNQGSKISSENLFAELYKAAEENGYKKNSAVDVEVICSRYCSFVYVPIIK